MRFRKAEEDARTAGRGRGRVSIKHDSQGSLTEKLPDEPEERMKSPVSFWEKQL